MALDYNGIEGISVRIGRVLGGINEINNFRYDTTDDRVSLIISGYPFTDQIAIDNIISERDQYRTTSSTWLQNLQEVATTTVIQQVNEDVPLVSLTLPVALVTWVTQMKAQGLAYARPTTSASTAAAASNYGNGQIVTSLIDNEGNTLDMVIPETITSVVTSDAGTGATAFQEPIRVQGLPFVDGLNWAWPQGSGASATISFNNGVSNSLVSNGGYDTWTSPSAPPDSWSIGTGTAGTTVVRSADNYRGTYALQFAGNGSELTSTYQAVTAAVLPNTVYCYAFFAKRSAGAAAGVLRVRLADGTGTTINNDQSTANSSTITVSSGLTTSYTLQYAFFQTPRVLPAVVRVYIDLTTAITNGETVNVDLGSFVAGTQVYAGGPYMAAFSGSTQAATDDYYETTVTNSETVGAFIPAMDRIFNLRQLGIRFPSTLGAPVSSNALISPSS